ncbi:hypothetical protein NC652_001930 [Populus alba x Populus x berolinensis]|nr:hypothetical protein NC652_001930 [Populus alba x Populus x berolinensis]
MQTQREQSIRFPDLKQQCNLGNQGRCCKMVT